MQPQFRKRRLERPRYSEAVAATEAMSGRRTGGGRRRQQPMKRVEDLDFSSSNYEYFEYYDNDQMAASSAASTAGASSPYFQANPKVIQANCVCRCDCCDCCPCSPGSDLLHIE
jgi:hypothetical protein